MLEALAWPRPSVVADRYASGASLAFTAPLDQLLTATEINEWAWQGVACEMLGLPLPQAPAHPATWDFDSALHTLRKFAAAESRRDVMTLLAIAAQHGLPAFYDDDAVSIGAGEGSRTWPLDALPASLADVDWTGLHDIPTVAGHRLQRQDHHRAPAGGHVRCRGTCSPDSIAPMAYSSPASRSKRGDYSGPSGARQVLRDPRVQAAVLETARGGILRRGLAVHHANAAIVTNVSPDHFGEYGVHDLSGLADAKLVLARVIADGDVLVLNADDPVLLDKSAGLVCPLAWFSLDHMNPRLQAVRAAARHELRRRGWRVVAACAPADPLPRRPSRTCR